MKKKIPLLAAILVSVITVTAFALVKFRQDTAPLTRVPAPTSDAGCSCCSEGKGNVTENARRLAFEFYANKYRDADISIEIKDFGCHMEAYILKGGAVVKRLNINGLTVTETG